MKQPNLFTGLIHLFFPHICPGCGSDTLQSDEFICFRCFTELPFTKFESIRNNKTERIFHGRVNVQNGMSLLYFSKDSLVQNLLHALKYNGNRELGIFLGRLMGKAIRNSTAFQNIDVLVPLPLFKEKEKKRGYNQSAILCEGIATETGFPVSGGDVIRTIHTETQTKKHRRERWQNVEGIFEVRNEEKLSGKHILLVDDVITTGATLEACAAALLKLPNTTVSIATLAIASH